LLCARDAFTFIVMNMDAVAIVIGVVMFAVLLAMVAGIERI
jgi:hypothetical protein